MNNFSQNFSNSPYSSGPAGGPDSTTVLEKRLKIGASWFFFIAVFSMISSLLILQGGSYHSAFGLGTTQLLSAAAAPHGGPGKAAAPVSQGLVLTFDLLASGFYVLYGVFGRRGQAWAFLTGMGFYALDLLLLLGADFLVHGGLQTASWLAVAFHGYALFRIFQGYTAARQLPDLRARQGPSQYGAPPPSVPDVWPPPPSGVA